MDDFRRTCTKFGRPRPRSANLSQIRSSFSEVDRIWAALGQRVDSGVRTTRPSWRTETVPGHPRSAIRSRTERLSADGSLSDANGAKTFTCALKRLIVDATDHEDDEDSEYEYARGPRGVRPRRRDKHWLPEVAWPFGGSPSLPLPARLCLPHVRSSNLAAGTSQHRIDPIRALWAEYGVQVGSVFEATVHRPNIVADVSGRALIVCPGGPALWFGFVRGGSSGELLLLRLRRPSLRAHL